jgi:hypothetical protein
MGAVRRDRACRAVMSDTSPEQELQQGDRVKHETLGEGEIVSIRPVHGVCEVRFAFYRQDGAATSTVALDKLTNVDPVPEKTLSEKLDKRSARLFGSENQDRRMVDVEVAWNVFAEHIDANQDKIGGALLCDSATEEKFLERLREILIYDA